MSAIVKCKKSSIEKVEAYLKKELVPEMKYIREGEDAVSFSVENDRLYVYYPEDEVWGKHYDYVNDVDYIFKNLKKEFPDVAISGNVIAQEGMANACIGTHFACSSNENKIHHIGAHEAQRCLICGKYHRNNVFLNADGFPDDEGSLNCICSPTCMLKFLLEGITYEYDFYYLNGVMFNDNEIREQISDYFDDGDFESIYNDFKSLFLANIDNYTYDFTKNEERIQNILSECKSTEWKAVILQITENIRKFKEKWSFLDNSKLPKYPFADGENRGFVDIPIKSATLNKFIEKNGISTTMLEDILKHTQTEIINRLVPLESVKCSADAILLILKLYYLLCTGREDLINDSIINLQINDIGNEAELSSNIDVMNLSLIFDFILENSKKISEELGSYEIYYRQ